MTQYRFEEVKIIIDTDFFSSPCWAGVRCMLWFETNVKWKWNALKLKQKLVCVSAYNGPSMQTRTEAKPRIKEQSSGLFSIYVYFVYNLATGAFSVEELTHLFNRIPYTSLPVYRRKAMGLVHPTDIFNCCHRDFVWWHFCLINSENTGRPAITAS